MVSWEGERKEEGVRREKRETKNKSWLKEEGGSRRNNERNDGGDKGLEKIMTKNERRIEGGKGEMEDD